MTHYGKAIAGCQGQGAHCVLMRPQALINIRLTAPSVASSLLYKKTSKNLPRAEHHIFQSAGLSF